MKMILAISAVILVGTVAWLWWAADHAPIEEDS